MSRITQNKSKERTPKQVVSLFISVGGYLGLVGFFLYPLIRFSEEIVSLHGGFFMAIEFLSIWIGAATGGVFNIETSLRKGRSTIFDIMGSLILIAIPVSFFAWGFLQANIGSIFIPAFLFGSLVSKFFWNKSRSRQFTTAFYLYLILIASAGAALFEFLLLLILDIEVSAVAIDQTLFALWGIMYYGMLACIEILVFFNAGPQILQGGALQSDKEHRRKQQKKAEKEGKATKTQDTYILNGREYESFEELPEEAKKAVREGKYKGEKLQRGEGSFIEIGGTRYASWDDVPKKYQKFKKLLKQS